MNRASIVIILCGAAGIAAPVLACQPQFKSTGKPPPGPAGQFTHFPPLVITDQGEIGASALGTPIVWNPQTGYQILQSSGPDQLAYVTDFIGPKETPVGAVQYGDSARPVIWLDRSGPPVPIPGFPVDQWYSHLNSVFANADGTMIVGNMSHKTVQNYDGLFVWRAGVRKAQGWEFITKFPPGKEMAGFGDLADLAGIAVGGSRDFGASKFEAMRWSKSTGFVFDGDLSGGGFQSGYSGVNAWGTVAVGLGSPASPGAAAVRWTARSGMVRLDEDAPPPIPSFATKFFDTDHSGFMHVGAVIQDGLFESLMWTPLDGMISTNDLLVNTYGLSAAAGWTLAQTEAISPDGRYIAGRGFNPEGVFETWWAEIRPFCYADCDRASTPKGGEAVLDVNDYICYFTHFVLDDLYANCNNDAELDINDFICFQTKFVLGCP